MGISTPALTFAPCPALPWCSYQRTCPVRYKSCQKGAGSHGTVHVCVGHAGAQFYDNGAPVQPQWVAFEVSLPPGRPRHPNPRCCVQGMHGAAVLLGAAACHIWWGVTSCGDLDDMSVGVPCMRRPHPCINDLYQQGCPDDE